MVHALKHETSIFKKQMFFVFALKGFISTRLDTGINSVYFMNISIDLLLIIIIINQILHHHYLIIFHF